ncbi:MAG: CPBP family intramembrane glutamic endopeptidase [Anaerolineaceae bacterium]
MPASPYPVPQSSRKLTITAWVVTLLISVIPDILLNLFTGTVPAWLVFCKMGALFLLALIAIFWKLLRPLRNFFVVMIAFFGLYALLPKFNFTWPGLQSLFGNSAFDARMQTEQTGKLVVALLMLVVLFLLGYKRRDLFLRGGDLRTDIQPVKWLGFMRPVSWVSFGLQWSLYISATMAVIQYIGMRPGGALMLKVLPILPSILFYAALNSFNEEVTYRIPMLATLEPVGGSTGALWMSASFFGLGHYFGVPGGIFGAIASIFMGWILGKAMLETRGFFWTWWIHFLSDIAIFMFLTAALLK